jgi:hypothetical protein
MMPWTQTSRPGGFHTPSRSSPYPFQLVNCSQKRLWQFPYGDRIPMQVYKPGRCRELRLLAKQGRRS